MDDEVTLSCESLPTSEEFELVGPGCATAEPELQIAGDASEEDLRESLQEVLDDWPAPAGGDGAQPKMLDVSSAQAASSGKAAVSSATAAVPANSRNANAHGPSEGKASLVAVERPKCERADSLEHNLIMYTTSPSPMDEDLMSISISLADGEYTVFDRITYLGSAVIADPRSVAEVRRNMAVLNEQSAKALNISLSLPVNSEGFIILYEPSSSNEIASFPISQITSHIPGEPGSSDGNCLTLVHKCSQGTIPDSTIYQCHVFRCEVPEAVPKIMQCFSAAVKKVPKLLLPKSESFGMDKSNPECINKNIITYVFDGTLEFKEDDTKGGYASCPKDKDYFKLRSKLEKSVTLTVQQFSENKELVIERCFGLLISQGRNVRNSDMQLIEMISFTKPSQGEKSSYVITGLWDPNEPAFEMLNTETPKDTRVYLTVAADLVIAGIQEPVRFVIETKAKIFPPSERFWYFSKRTLYEQFYLKVREIDVDVHGEYALQVVEVTSSTKLQNRKAMLNLNLPSFVSRSTNVPTPSSPDETDSVSDNDEPLLSGTGDVSKDCTEGQLEGWSGVLAKWRQNLSQRPRSLSALVRRGVPEALRGEVWQLLAGCHDQKELVEVYKNLINKDCTYDSIIQRDIYRTFPAHELFSEKNGPGQESLYKICKAYSLYDPEIGYCQGLSFLIAALLLHMPEEQAFGVLLKIMFEYRSRDMFRNALEELHLKFFQLRKLMEDQMPGLLSHFDDLGIEVHMFASQWFLTLFTAKFPLITVFFIIDLFLLDGMAVIFQVAVALLMLSQKELLALDFEGVLKHFRVSLPKKYRTEESSRVLIQNAVKVKVKKLKRYEKEYIAFKAHEKLQEDPVKILQRDNKMLLESNLHLDRENDDLAYELINTKLQLRNELIKNSQWGTPKPTSYISKRSVVFNKIYSWGYPPFLIVKSEEKVESQARDLHAAMHTIGELEEEKKRLSLEVAQLKEMCRRELQRAESDSQKNETIISQYKQICTQMSARLEKEQLASRQALELMKARMQACEACSSHADLSSATVESNRPLPLLNAAGGARDAEAQARELELELARTKLALVEAECKNQDLTHQLNAAVNELQTSKNTWFQKTFSSIRDAAKKDNPSSKDINY